MKRFLTTLFVVLLTVSAANAQKFGITGNLAFDKTESNVIAGLKPGLGWGAGLKFRFVSSMGLGLDAALKYASESISFYPNEFGADVYEESDRISLLSIPVNLRYDFAFPVIKKIAFPFLFVGPEFCYSLDGIDWKNTGYEEVFKENKAQWNLNFGIGVMLFSHLELAYNYTSKLSDRFSSSSEGYKYSAKDIFSSSSNKILLTYCF